VKLPVHAFRSFLAYHTWGGVACGLVLHLMFVAGAVTLFLAPIRIWEEPLQHHPASETLKRSPQALLEAGRAAIAHLPEAPRRLWLGLPQGQDGVARFQYSDLKTGKWIGGWLDPRSGEFVPEREQVGTFLYHLHYLWHPSLPELEYLAGLLGVAFLLLITTGVLIHLKDLVRNFFQFRPRAARKTFWTDLHNVLGVMGLPFQIAFCYTGAMIVLGPVLLTGISEPVFGRDVATANQVVWNEPASITPPGKGPAPALSLDEVLAIARREVPGFAPISFGMQGYQKEHGKVRAYGSVSPSVSASTVGAGPSRYANVLIDQQSGEVLHVESPSTDLASHSARRWVTGIHYVYFGNNAVRILLALLTLAGCATILTGNWIWLAKRKARGAGGKPHLLARLTAGVGAGTFLAIAVFFVASRLLPMRLPERIATEQLYFFGALLGCIAWGLFARSALAVWWQQLGLAGLLLCVVPVLQARLTPAGLFGDGPRITTVMAVDLGLLGCGLLLLCVALLLYRRAQRGASAEDTEADGSDSGEADEPDADNLEDSFSRASGRKRVEEDEALPSRDDSDRSDGSGGAKDSDGGVDIDAPDADLPHAGDRS
jgi:uncharacterized iron-regulated membrane protein